MNPPAAGPSKSPASGAVIARRVAIGVAVLALIAAPYAIQQVYYVNIASQILLYAVFALGLNVLVGYAGLVSLGHAGLFGVAAYAVAYLLGAGYGHAVAILAGLAAGLVVTAGFAALALRSTGISFIMITLALGEIIWGLAYRWISLTGGDNGISVSTRPAPFGLSLDSPRAFYDATLIVFLLAVTAVAIFVRSPFGAALCGTRDQPRRMCTRMSSRIDLQASTMAATSVTQSSSERAVRAPIDPLVVKPMWATMISAPASVSWRACHKSKA